MYTLIVLVCTPVAPTIVFFCKSRTAGSRKRKNWSYYIRCALDRQLQHFLSFTTRHALKFVFHAEVRQQGKSCYSVHDRGFRVLRVSVFRREIPKGYILLYPKKRRGETVREGFQQMKTRVSGMGLMQPLVQPLPVLPAPPLSLALLGGVRVGEVQHGMHSITRGFHISERLSTCLTQ